MAILKTVTALGKPIAKFGLEKFKNLSVVHQFRLEQALESSIAETWDSLSGFFHSEGIDFAHRQIIASECVFELLPFAENPQLLIDQSLDGEKLFEHLRSNSAFPEAIVENKLESIYRTIFPLVATILFRTSVIVEQLEKMEFKEVLRRFDSLTEQVGFVVSNIQQIQQRPQTISDELFARVLRQSLKRVLLNVEVTGLYGDVVLKQAKEEMFVLPNITTEKPTKESKRTRSGERSAETIENHLDYFVEQKSRSIVRGGPGSGKSTWSRWLQIQTIRKSEILVLYVKLRAYADTSLPLIVDLVRELIGPNMAQEIEAELVSEWVSRGKIGLIFDGFDEIAPDSRNDVAEQIIEMTDYNSCGPTVITSRPLNTDHLTNFRRSWIAWAIEPFDPPRVVDYIKKWYNYTSVKEGADREVDASALFSTLRRDPHISPLTSNPLMLATLLMVHHNDGELPKGRSKLYGRYIDGMLGIWDDKQQINADVSGLDREQKKRVLTALAIALHIEKRDEFDEGKTLEVVKNALYEFGYDGQAHLALDSLRERSGLIVGPGSYSFTHKSIGEYLVAQAIIDGNLSYGGVKLDRLKLNQELASDRWLNVLFFWGGSAPTSDVQTFIGGISIEQSAGLVIGLLWDQMDRFKIEWVRGVFEKVVYFWGNSGQDSLEKAGSRQYYGWSFNECKMSEARWMKIPVAPVKHVSLNGIDSEIAISGLVHRIGMNLDQIEEIKCRALYSVLIHAALPWAENCDLGVYRANFQRWPLWLKKSQAALRILKDYSGGSPDRLLREWEDIWEENDGTSVLWISSACLLRAENALGSKKGDFQMFGNLCLEFLRIPWSDEALVLSDKWIMPDPDEEIKEEDLWTDIFEHCLTWLSEENSEVNENLEMESLVDSIKSELKRLQDKRCVLVGR